MKPETQHGGGSAGDRYVPTSGNTGYEVEHYDLALSYRPEPNRLDAVAKIHAVATMPLTRLSLDLSGLKVAKVTIDGRRVAKFAVRERKLVIWPERPLKKGQSFRIAVSYAGNPRPIRGVWGEVGWEELTEGALVAAQPNGAPSWFPCNDHPSSKATYAIEVTTDSPYTAIVTGTLLSRRTRASSTTWTYRLDSPTTTYLVSVQIGRYELHELAADPVPQHAALPARLLPAFTADFARQPQMMACFAEWFGPYPYDAYTVVVTADDLEIPVEAQGLSIFGANYVDGHGQHERLIAHELAHQWFGNSLTVRGWQHIWLNEGFACYAEWLWSEAGGGPSADVLAKRYWQRLAKLPQDLVLSDPGPSVMFDDRVYKRGALTLHALRLTVGDEAFFELLRAWVGEHRHGSVTTSDFLALVNQGAGTDVANLLLPWLHELPLPTLPASRSRR